MRRKIKLIWDFRGLDAAQTAQHHKIHLAEYATKEKLLINKTGVEIINENYAIAFLIADEAEVFKVRDALKPLRAEVEEN